MTNEASALLDTDAHNKALDADAGAPGARVGCGFQSVYVTATVMVWDEDGAAANENFVGRENRPGSRFYLHQRDRERR